MSDGTRSLGFVAGAFGVIMLLLYLGMDALVDHRSQPNAYVNTGANGPTRIELERNPAGQYRVPGTINGQPVNFLVDTGATHVAIPARVADSLSLERGPSVDVETAGGRVRSEIVRIDRIAVGGIEVRNVPGTVNPSLSGTDVLLGMTFLRHIDFRQIGDRFILEAPND